MLTYTIISILLERFWRFGEGETKRRGEGCRE